MTQEKAGWAEKAINKVAEMALATQVEEAKGLQVRIKTNLKNISAWGS